MQGMVARYMGRMLHHDALRSCHGVQHGMKRLKQGMRVLFRNKPWRVILVNDSRAVIEQEETKERISISNTADLAEIVRE